MNWLDWLGLTNSKRPLEVGDAAPGVTCLDEHGREIQLADLYNNAEWTLVYFYPRADTPGCTAQACSLRDDFAALTQRNVQVVGVSRDDSAAQKRFQEKYRLPFKLLADHDGCVADAFGVGRIVGMTRRQSFLIRAGKIVWRDLSASTREQARDILHALDQLA